MRESYNFIDFLWLKYTLKVEIWQTYHIPNKDHLGIQWAQQNKKNKSEEFKYRNRASKELAKEIQSHGVENK